jgi:hypothetical protein
MKKQLAVLTGSRCPLIATIETKLPENIASDTRRLAKYEAEERVLWPSIRGGAIYSRKLTLQRTGNKS